MILRPRLLLEVPVGVETTTVDVLDVAVGDEDVVYYDPPYTKRQYAAYYHILETIAYGDEPSVGGADCGRGRTWLRNSVIAGMPWIRSIRRPVPGGCWSRWPNRSSTVASDLLAAVCGDALARDRYQAAVSVGTVAYVPEEFAQSS